MATALVRGLGASKRQPAAQEVVGVEQPQHQVGVGHRGPRTTPPVGRRSRIGAGAHRAHAQQAAGIDPGDAAAARAHRAHVDLGQPQQVVVDGRLGGADQRASTDGGDVEGRAAHVDHDDVGLVRERERGDGRERRPAHHRVDRSRGDLAHCHHAALAVGDQQGAAKTRLAHRVLQPAEVGRHDGVQRGVDGGRDGAAVLARDRVERVAERHRHLGPKFIHDLADPALVRGLYHRPEQADGDGVHRAALEVCHGSMHVLFRERRDLVAPRVDPPAHLVGAVAGDEGPGIVEAPVEGALAWRLAKRQHVGVTGGADQPDRTGAALDQRVGGDRGAVHDARRPGEEVGEVPVEGAGGERQRVHETPLERGRRRRRLDHRAPRAVRDHAVGKGPADVDRDLILAHPPSALLAHLRAHPRNACTGGARARPAAVSWAAARARAGVGSPRDPYYDLKINELTPHAGCGQRKRQ